MNKDRHCGDGYEADRLNEGACLVGFCAFLSEEDTLAELRRRLGAVEDTVEHEYLLDKLDEVTDALLDGSLLDPEQMGALYRIADVAELEVTTIIKREAVTGIVLFRGMN